MNAFYTAVITINLIAGLSILISGLKEDYRHFKTFALLCFLCIAYTAITWSLHLSIELQNALFYSKLQFVCMLIALPLFTYTFGTWCNVEKTNQITLLVTICVFIILILNFISETPLRFGKEVELVFQSSPIWGDFVTLTGNTSPLFYSFQSVFVVVAILGIWFAIKLFNKASKLVGAMLTLTILGQLFANWLGAKIDANDLSLIYVGGVPFTILSIFVMLRLAYSFKLAKIDIDIERKKLNDLKQDFFELAKGVSDPNSNDFFERMLKTLYSFTQSKVIFIGMVNEHQKSVKTTLALSDGEISTNFEYELAGTPCQQVSNNEVCVYPDKVASLFPEDHLLEEMGIVSYIGLPLLDEQGNAYGLLVLLHTQEFSPSQEFRHILGIFASRASAEYRRQSVENKLQQMAYYDYATRLPNRARLINYLEELSSSVDKQAQIVLFLIDIDHFNYVNRKYGKDIADALIRELGVRLLNYSSSEIYIAREGGDEFAVVFTASISSIHGKIAVQWEALKSIFEAPFTIGKRMISVTCSAGVISSNAKDLLKNNIVSQAGIALHQAKAKGRKQCVKFEETLASELDHDRALVVKLQKAIAEETLFVVYQPKHNKTGEIVGAEALVRWIDSEEGFVSPDNFIPLAESNGLIGELTMFVARTVSRNLKHMESKGVLLPKVSVNISALDINNLGFVDSLEAEIASEGLKPNQIELEITETGIIDSFDLAIIQLGKLRDKGFSIALDDFGTGYSSLSYLDSLPLDVLKIDRSFISKMQTKRGRAMVDSIISIAKIMDFKIVAEGTESEQDVAELVAMGCDTFQGYFFSKPLELDDFVAYCTAPSV